MSIVEFPGVLVPSFEPTLNALKRMKKESVPFSELLVPMPEEKNTTEVVTLSPPPYALSSGFKFNLNVITKDDSDLFLTPGQPFDISQLVERSISRPCASHSCCQRSELEPSSDSGSSWHREELHRNCAYQNSPGKPAREQFRTNTAIVLHQPCLGSDVGTFA